MHSDSGTTADRKDQPVYIRLDTYEREGLEQLANEKGLSLSRMVALLIREELNKTNGGNH